MKSSVIWFCTYVMLVATQDNKYAANKQCDIRNCSGPLGFYRSLKCKPVYNDDDCCAWHYDCDHLYRRSNAEDRHKKCYVNGHEYEIGEKIREEDASLCETECVCEELSDGFADFVCITLEDTLEEHFKTPRLFTGCWREPLEECLATPIRCPRNYLERPICIFDGKTYRDGDYMMLKGRPDLLCMCRADVSGTVFLKCTNFTRWADVHATYFFYKNCAPIYLPDDQIYLGYHDNKWRCQDADDVIIPVNQSLFDSDRYTCMFCLYYGTHGLYNGTQLYIIYDPNIKLKNLPYFY